MANLYRQRRTSGKRRFIERIKASVYLEAVVAMETMDPQSNLEEKDSSSILKDNFSSRLHPSIFTSIRPELLDRLIKTSFSSIEINVPLPALVYSIL